MEVTIRTRHVEVSEAVRRAAAEKVTRLTRFLEGMDHAEVVFSEEKNPRIADRDVCEVTLAGHGHLVRARAAAADHFSAIDRVVDKLEHQMLKLKGKLVSRHHPRRHGPVESHDSHEPADEDVQEESPYRIVKTKRFSMKPMTPEEAAMQMDLLGHEFYFFTNAESQQAAVVYRRTDGDVGLIEAG